MGHGATSNADVFLVEKHGERIAKFSHYRHRECMSRFPAVIDRDHDAFVRDLAFTLLPIQKLAHADYRKFCILDRLHLVAEIIDVQLHVVVRLPFDEIVIA